MFKSSKVSIVVDSVERALKFYAEKLLFGIVSLRTSNDGGLHISFAEIRKGKCSIILRMPHVDELAEFSMVRRCNGRATGIVLELKKDIEKYFEACKRKRLNVISNLQEARECYKVFQLKDPYGIKLTVVQALPEAQEFACNPKTFCGMDVSDKQGMQIAADSDVPEDMIQHLRSIGLSRRASKRYIKFWFKQCGKSGSGKKATTQPAVEPVDDSEDSDFE